MKKKLIVKHGKTEEKEIQKFLIDADSDGKFKATYSGTPIFMLETIIRLFKEITKQNKKTGIQLVTGLIGGLLSLDEVDCDDILKELDSLSEED